MIYLLIKLSVWIHRRQGLHCRSTVLVRLPCGCSSCCRCYQDACTVASNVTKWRTRSNRITSMFFNVFDQGMQSITSLRLQPSSTAVVVLVHRTTSSLRALNAMHDHVSEARWQECKNKQNPHAISNRYSFHFWVYCV